LRGLRINETGARISLSHLMLCDLKAERRALVRRVWISHAQEDRGEGSGDHEWIDNVSRQMLDR
jgi:hypothetical protein